MSVPAVRIGDGLAERDQVVFNLAVALRRVLILVDKRGSAARFATDALAAADRALGR